MQGAELEPVIKTGKYGVAVIDSEATLFRTVHVGAEVFDYEPVLEFAPDGVGVNAFPCSPERVAELLDRIAMGWRPEIGAWFADFQGAYEHGMETARGLPARFWYDVYRMPTGAIWIKRRPAGRDESYLEPVIALRPDGEFITDPERGLKGPYTVDVLTVTGSFTTAVAEAEKALRWPEASTEGAMDDYKEDEEESAA
ncbi:MAG: hypothetical protein ACREMZ_11245 [Gemmatimonadales bacterium]